MSNLDHTCVICDAHIGHGFLMCPGHWHMVPRQAKTDVYRTWGAFTRTAYGHPEVLTRRREYLQARDAAIAAVQRQIDPPAPTTTTPPTTEGATPCRP